MPHAGLDDESRAEELADRSGLLGALDDHQAGSITISLRPQPSGPISCGTSCGGSRPLRRPRRVCGPAPSGPHRHRSWRFRSLSRHGGFLPILFSDCCFGRKAVARWSEVGRSIEIVPTSIPATIVHTLAGSRLRNRSPKRHKLGYWCLSRGPARNRVAASRSSRVSRRDSV